MGFTSPWHWAIVLVLFVLMFGSKRLPDAARGVGRSLRIFKSEIKEMSGDDKPATSDEVVPPAALPPATAVHPVAAAEAVAPKASPAPASTTENPGA